MTTVHLSFDEVEDALAVAAARKLGMRTAYVYHVHIAGEWLVNESQREFPIMVEVTPMVPLYGTPLPVREVR